MTRKFGFSVMLGLGVASMAATVVAVDPADEIEVTSEAEPTSRYFGQKVAMSGDRIVVGTRQAANISLLDPDPNGGYVQTTIDRPENESVFGVSVDIDGDTTVAGARRAAYVFTPDGLGGFDEIRLAASDGSDRLGFGADVAVSGENVVVGESQRAFGSYPAAGAAYFYSPNGTGGYDETVLDAPNRASDRRFGQSIDIAGGIIVVGAPFDSANGAKSGTVFVYTSDGAGGFDRARLVPSDGGASDRFGEDVAIEGDVIIVGSHAHGGSGAVYLFHPDGSGGYTESKLVASDGVDGDRFGKSVAMNGNTVVVGAPGVDSVPGNRVGIDGGAAYVFESDGAGGYAETKIVASNVTFQDQYGAAVAVSGDTVVVGAPGHNRDNTLEGVVYVYDPGRIQPPLGASITVVQDALQDRNTNFSFGGTLGNFRLDDPVVDDGDAYSNQISFDRAAGRYVIRQSGYSNWARAEVDCDGHPFDYLYTADGRRVAVELANGDNITCTFTNDLGGSISTRVFNDRDANGTRNSSDPWTTLRVGISLYDEDGGVRYLLTSTDGNARAVYESVAPGSYKVCMGVPKFYEATKPSMVDPSIGKPCYDVEITTGSRSFFRFGIAPVGSAS